MHVLVGSVSLFMSIMKKRKKLSVVSMASRRKSVIYLVGVLLGGGSPSWSYVLGTSMPMR